MDLESLRCFVAVAEALHFRTGAERVSLSPAAVSDRVRRLEAELEVSLFDRTSRRVALTDAGRRLLPHARRLLDDAARAGAVARGDDRPLPFELVLGTRYELGLSWLCPALGPLEALRPERGLHLYMGDTAALLDRLERSAIDAAVLSARLTRPYVRYALLHEERYVLVGVEGGPRRPEEAPDHDLVDVSPDLPLLRYLLDAWPERDAWRFRRHVYRGGIAGIRHELVHRGGVAVLPAYFVADDLAAGRLVELLPATALRSDHFRLLWRAGHPREAELEQLAADLLSFPLR